MSQETVTYIKKRQQCMVEGRINTENPLYYRYENRKSPLIGNCYSSTVTSGLGL